MLVAATLALAACSDSPTEPGSGAPATVIVEGGAGIIGVGDTVPLTVRVVDAGGRALTAAVSWRSLDTAVAKVGADGRVVGWDAGTTGVIATVGDHADTASFRVEVQPRAISMEVRPFCCSADTAYIGQQFYFRGVVTDGRGRVLSGVPVTYEVPDTSAAMPAVIESLSGWAYTVGLTAGGILVSARAGELRVERRLDFQMVPIDMDAAALTQVGIGANFACGLDAGSGARCWGYGDDGRLGRPAGSAQPWIAPVSGGLAFSKLEVGREGACGITTAKRLWCWGGSGLPAGASTPTVILDGVDVAQVSIGKEGDETCALTSAGEVWCWGLVYGARVDTPTRLTTPVPMAEVAVGDGLNGNFASDGRLVCVLTTGGQPWCADAGAGAPLRQVTGAPSALHGLVAGTGFACGLTSDGRAWCWGDNTLGELGTGTGGGGSSTAQPVQTTARFVTLGAGDGFACGITADGTIWCWGRAPTSQFAPYARALPYRLSQDERFRALIPGALGVCGLRADGDLRCANFYTSPAVAP